MSSRQAEHTDLRQRFDKLLHERDHLAKQDKEQRQTIQNLHKELGGDAELDDDDDDDLYTLSIKRGCERRVTEAEERLKRFTSEMNKKLESQEALLNKTKQERREQALLLVGLQNERKEQTARIEKLRKDRDDSRSEADDAHRGAISIFNEQKKHESYIDSAVADNQRAVEERDSTILDFDSN